jgi:hypothetical protein
MKNTDGPDHGFLCAGRVFFLLDSSHPASLTLRDYSKVVAEHKLSFSSENQILPRYLHRVCWKKMQGRR